MRTLIDRYLLHSPGRTIVSSVLFLIIIGTFLLSLPIAQKVPVSRIDTLFTAVSATSVTGLMTVPLDSFTLFGQLVILALIQIGAIGLITLSVFLLSLFMNLSLSTQMIARESLEIENTSYRSKLFFFIIGLTAFVEALGAFLIFCTIKPYYSFGKSLYFAVFQAISSFCNSGFSILPYQTNAFSVTSQMILLSIMGLLVFIGGLGFVVWHEVATSFRAREIHKHFHYSLHTKIIVSFTLALILLLSTVIFFVEYWHKFLEAPHISYIAQALFNGICLRSAGFTTLPFPGIHFATLLAVMMTSLIGSAPGSTGSGMKVTTFALCIAAIRATLKGRANVELYGRTIPNDQVFKAISILSLSLMWIGFSIFTLLLLEPSWRFVDVVFEMWVSFSNLGISTGITPFLSFWSKIVIMTSMFIGRIGSLTLLLALRRPNTPRDFYYPEERILMS